MMKPAPALVRCRAIHGQSAKSMHGGRCRQRWGRTLHPSDGGLVDGGPKGWSLHLMRDERCVMKERAYLIMVDPRAGPCTQDCPLWYSCLDIAWRDSIQGVIRGSKRP